MCTVFDRCCPCTFECVVNVCWVIGAGAQHVLHVLCSSLLNFLRAQNSIKSDETTIFGLIVVVGCVLQKCVLPKGLANKNHTNVESSKVVRFDGFHNAFNHHHIQIRCKRQHRCIYTHPRPVSKVFSSNIGGKQETGPNQPEIPTHFLYGVA